MSAAYFQTKQWKTCSILSLWDSSMWLYRIAVFIAVYCSIVWMYPSLFIFLLMDIWVVVSIYTPTNCAGKFPLLHILVNTWITFFHFSHFGGCLAMSHCGRICTSIITNKIGHLFIYLLVIWLSPWTGQSGLHCLVFTRSSVSYFAGVLHIVWIQALYHVFQIYSLILWQTFPLS